MWIWQKKTTDVCCTSTWNETLGKKWHKKSFQTWFFLVFCGNFREKAPLHFSTHRKFEYKHTNTQSHVGQGFPTKRVRANKEHLMWCSGSVVCRWVGSRNTPGWCGWVMGWVADPEKKLRTPVHGLYPVCLSLEALNLNSAMTEWSVQQKKKKKKRGRETSTEKCGKAQQKKTIWRSLIHLGSNLTWGFFSRELEKDTTTKKTGKGWK